MMEVCAVLLFCVVFSVARCRTIFQEFSQLDQNELSFMKKYGYLPSIQDGEDFAYTPQSISDAVVKMQAFSGLPQTGILDDQTKALFKKRRCGMKDIEDSTAIRKRRYVLQRGWNKHTISYSVINGSSTLPKDRVEDILQASLAVWAPHGALRFYRVDEGSADIQLSFYKGAHGDGFPFDGPGHVVAHAFAPPHGAMHFDDDEQWGEQYDDENEDITDFFAVAVHEIGHALGLSHSNVSASVMYPYYQVPVEKLHSDDILGMQELYIKPQQSVRYSDVELMTQSSGTTRSSVDVPKSTKADITEVNEDDDVPDICYANYDTIQVIQGKIYVFEEEFVWVMNEKKILEEGYPKRFHSIFKGLPKRINAIKTIYEKMNGNIVIFSGKKYWEFDPQFRFKRIGKLTDYKIPKHVQELSSVFVSNYNNKTYLIEYETFWRFDEARGLMDKGYPRDMVRWRDLPYPVDAALIWKGDTYFFRGPRFWRFDNTVVRAHEYYPLPTAPIWFPCEPSPGIEVYATNERD